MEAEQGIAAAYQAATTEYDHHQHWQYPALGYHLVVVFEGGKQAIQPDRTSDKGADHCEY